MPSVTRSSGSSASPEPQTPSRFSQLRQNARVVFALSFNPSGALSRMANLAMFIDIGIIIPKLSMLSIVVHCNTVGHTPCAGRTYAMLSHLCMGHRPCCRSQIAYRAICRARGAHGPRFLMFPIGICPCTACIPLGHIQEENACRHPIVYDLFMHLQCHA